MKALREATPQALHHFTRFAQVDELVEASEADSDLGFMERLLERDLAAVSLWFVFKNEFCILGFY